MAVVAGPITPGRAMTAKQDVAGDVVETPAFQRAMRRRGLTLALLTLVYFFSYMDRYILAILLEPIKADLHLSDTQLGLLSGLAFAVFYATLGIPVARLADRSNRRNIIAVALTLWSGMTALCGLAGNFTQLLLARIGVGVGEAGSGPPSHSIIADLYPPEKRSGAMAIFSSGVVLGGSAGTIIGGAIAAEHGWRVAIMAVGLPGVLLAVIVRLFAVEPRRGQSDPGHRAASNEPMPGAWQAFTAMWANGPAFHLVMGVTITSMIGYAVSSFGPAFLQRSMGLSMKQVALTVAPMVAVLGTISGIGGGKLADWAGKRWGLHAQCWMVAILKVFAFPCAIVFYLAPSQTVAIGAYALYLLFASSYLGPSFALIQGLAPVRMRAMWAAVTLLVINLIGLGLGPTLVGVLSDVMKPYVGPQQSLRYALVIVAGAAPWTIYHYWKAGVLLKRRDANKPAMAGAV